MNAASSTVTHPFAIWAGQLATLGACTLDGGQNNDIKLSAIGAKRMSIGVYKGNPLMCFLPEDQEAIQSIRWSSAAVLMNLKDQDWIALSCKDIRPQGAVGIAFPVRLFIPVGHGRLQAWRNSPVDPQVHLGVMSFPKENGLPFFDGSPFLSLPAKLSYMADQKRISR
jgi:hypothetical protein